MRTERFDLTGVSDEPAEAGIPLMGELLGEECFRQDAPLFISADPDLWLYRGRTTALLRRYFRHSIEVGRLPSLLGREFFRTRVTASRAVTFEDAVIFVHDVERCLDRLSNFEKGLIGKVVFENFSHDEAARLMGCWRRTVGRRLPEAIDHLSDILLTNGLLARLPANLLEAEKSCQEAKNDGIGLTDCEQAE